MTSILNGFGTAGKPADRDGRSWADQRPSRTGVPITMPHVLPPAMDAWWRGASSGRPPGGRRGAQDASASIFSTIAAVTSGIASLDGVSLSLIWPVSLQTRPASDTTAVQPISSGATSRNSGLNRYRLPLKSCEKGYTGLMVASFRWRPAKYDVVRERIRSRRPRSSETTSSRSAGSAVAPVRMTPAPSRGWRIDRTTVYATGAVPTIHASHCGSPVRRPT